VSLTTVLGDESGLAVHMCMCMYGYHFIVLKEGKNHCLSVFEDNSLVLALSLPRVSQSGGAAEASPEWVFGVSLEQRDAYSSRPSIKCRSHRQTKRELVLHRQRDVAVVLHQLSLCHVFFVFFLPFISCSFVSTPARTESSFVLLLAATVEYGLHRRILI
jgi:hypothetical protein